MSVRYLVARRVVQAAVMGLFMAGSYLGYDHLISGNLSASTLFGQVPLTDPYAALQTLATGHILGPLSLIGAAIVLGFWGLLGGRSFCAWVCPMNPVTDLAAWLHRRWGLRSIVRLPRNTRHLVLVLSLVMSALLGVAAFEWISPIGVLQRALVFGLFSGWLVVFGVFLFDLFLLKHGFCGHVCPLGAFYGVVGRAAQVRIGFDKEKCTDCMKCHKVCPERQVLKPFLPAEAAVPRTVLDGACTNCGRCIDVCDDDALFFSLRALRARSCAGENKEVNP